MTAHAKCRARSAVNDIQFELSYRAVTCQYVNLGRAIGPGRKCHMSLNQAPGSWLRMSVRVKHLQQVNLRLEGEDLSFIIGSRVGPGDV